MTSKAVTREQFEIRSELEVVHFPTGTVFRAQPYIDPCDRVQSIRGGVERESPGAIISNRSKAWRLSCCLNEQLEIAGLASRLRTCDGEAAMAWVGRTNFSEIGVGASLRLEEIPTVPGRVPSPVRANPK